MMQSSAAPEMGGPSQSVQIEVLKPAAHQVGGHMTSGRHGGHFPPNALREAAAKSAVWQDVPVMCGRLLLQARFQSLWWMRMEGSTSRTR